MIRPLATPCEGANLAAVLHPAPGGRAALIVSGGVQTRAGPHRLFTQLAEALAARGVTALRFDRRGVGDSDGEDAGFLGSAADIAAAAAALREQGSTDITGIGLCDGAAALALFGAEAGCSRLVLLNPWSIDGDVAPMSASAARERTVRRLANPRAWLRIVSGEVDVIGALRSLFAKSEAPVTGRLATRLVDAINAFGKPVLVLLSRNDATAQTFADVLPALGDHVRPVWLDTADHTLTRPEHRAAMLAAIDDFMKNGSGGGT